MSKGQNTATIYGAEGKTDLLLFDPENIKLVGLDEGWRDKSHPLYDESVHLPLDEAMIASLAAQGNLEPVGVHRDGGDVLCVYGRQRVKNAREANRRGAKIQIRAVVQRAKDPADLFGMVVAENAVRRTYNPMTMARDILRLINWGRSEKQAAIVFGCSEGTIRNRLALLDCDDAVQAAVQAGKIGATLAAQEFAPMKREEQAAHLAKLVEANTLGGAEAKENVRRLRNGAANGAKPAMVKRMQTRDAIEAARKRLKKAGTEDALLARNVLKWALGEGCAADIPARVAEALEPDEGAAE